MRDPELVFRAQLAASALERAWQHWRLVHGLVADPMPAVSSYVGYSLEEPWGQPRVVFGLASSDAEQLAALLDRHDCIGPVHAMIAAKTGVEAAVDSGGRDDQPLLVPRQAPSMLAEQVTSGNGRSVLKPASWRADAEDGPVYRQIADARWASTTVPARQEPGGKAKAGQAPAGKAAGGESPAGQARARKAVGEEAPAGQAPAGKVKAGKVAAAEAPVEKATGGEAATGKTPAAKAPAGKSPSARAPGKQAEDKEAEAEQAQARDAATSSDRIEVPGTELAAADVSSVADAASVADVSDITVQRRAADRSPAPGDPRPRRDRKPTASVESPVGPEHAPLDPAVKESSGQGKARQHLADAAVTTGDGDNGAATKDLGSGDHPGGDEVEGGGTVSHLDAAVEEATAGQDATAAGAGAGAGPHASIADADRRVADTMSQDARAADAAKGSATGDAEPAEPAGEDVPGPLTRAASTAKVEAEARIRAAKQQSPKAAERGTQPSDSEGADEASPAEDAAQATAPDEASNGTAEESQEPTVGADEKPEAIIATPPVPGPRGRQQTGRGRRNRPGRGYPIPRLPKVKRSGSVPGS
jgi:hypothetical protein